MSVTGFRAGGSTETAVSVTADELAAFTLSPARRDQRSPSVPSFAQMTSHRAPDVDGRTEREELAFPRVARSKPLYLDPFGQVTDTAVSVRAGQRHDSPRVQSYGEPSKEDPGGRAPRSWARQRPL